MPRGERPLHFGSFLLVLPAWLVLFDGPLPVLSGSFRLELLPMPCTS